MRIPFFFAEGNRTNDIFVVDLDGGNATRLTDTVDGNEFVPRWSPDGAQIAYDFTPLGGEGDIYLMDADGSNVRQLTTNPANDTEPFWSPDGTQILFVSSRDGDNEIFVINTDGTGLRQLTSNDAFDGSPSWSLDGTQVLFVSTRDVPEALDLYIMDADGSNVVRLTENDSVLDALPRWAPRKRGVEVTESTIIIPNAVSLNDLTTPEAVSQVRAAVVRIETDLGSGSGFIFYAAGFILTNNHVITGAEEITVFLENGTKLAATVVGQDLVRDLAVLKVEVPNLPVLEFGDLSQAPQASEVLVVGYPLGTEDLSVTRCLLSALKEDSGRNMVWIQTDAAVNPGNSGGPLLNLQGQVIGMVTAKFVDVSIEGVGFAISVNTIKLYLDKLKNDETIP